MIIIVSNAVPPEHSGAGRRMYSFFQYLKNNGFEVRYVTHTPIVEENLIVVRKHQVEKYLGRFASILIFLSSLLQLIYRLFTGIFKNRGKVRCIWLVSVGPITAAASVVFKCMGYRVITQNTLMYSDDPARRPTGILNIHHKILRFQYYLTDVVTSNSPGLHQLSEPHHPYCVMIPNPVEIQEGTGFNNHRSRKNILIVGKLSHRKGTDIVFKIIDIVHRSKPDILFTFIGPYNGMDKQIQKLYDTSENINRNNVQIVGYKLDPRPWYKSADIFLLPSRQEGFGTVFIEAMSYGLPVVCKNIAGITDYVFPEGYPAIIPSEDPDAYAKQIQRLIDDDQYYLSLSKELQKNVNRFEKERIYEQYVKLIMQE
jgi:glycosyltransferase involved in cell wall biosynthesis